MLTYRHRAPTSHTSCARESGRGYDVQSDAGSPLERMADVAARLEAVKREALDVWRDVVDWGGTAATTGLSASEWLTLAGRLSGADATRLEQLVQRLPGLPVTAGLLAQGELTIDQAVTICRGTTRLSGDRLARVEKEAATAAADRNRRGDHPDIAGDVDLLVQRQRKPAEQERIERRQLDGPGLWAQQDFDGGGTLGARLDPVAFATTWAAIEDAAGAPSPDEPRHRQRAEGLVAMGRAWLAGSDGADASTTGDTDGAQTATVRLGAATAKPTVAVTVDLTCATPSAFATQIRSVGGRRAPMLTARMIDTLTCNAALIASITDGVRPLAELRNQSTMPTAVRRQILLRDLGCRWPGCTAPVHHCDVHHLQPRSEGGDHDVDNGAALCRRHHVRLHGSHWHASLDGRTGRFDLRRSADGPIHHTTWPHNHAPGRARPDPGPEVAPTR